MDAATQQQLDELRPHLEALRLRRNEHQRRHDALQVQAARYGRDAPPHITAEITDLIVAIRDVEGLIRDVESKVIQLETVPATDTVLVLPDQAPFIPKLSAALVDERLRAQDRVIQWLQDTILEMRRQAELEHNETIVYRTVETQDRREGTQTHQEQHRTLRFIVIVGALVIGPVVVAVVVLLIEVF